MKYTIGFNQEKLMNQTPKITLEEATILDYLIVICSTENKKVKRERIDREGTYYTWVNLSRLLTDLPILHYESVSPVSRKINSLKKIGYISTLTLPHKKGKRLYVALNNQVSNLIFDQESPLLDSNDPIAPQQQAHCTTAIDTNTNDNNTNDNIKSLFNFWNEQGIIKHSKLTGRMKTKIQSTLKEYSFKQICSAIVKYKTVLELGKKPEDKKYWWNHKWTLEDFIKRGITRFVDQPLEDFLRSRTGGSFQEKKKMPYYQGAPVREKNGKKFVVVDGEWREFVGQEEEIIYK